jgi:hypothetical protein
MLDKLKIEGALVGFEHTKSEGRFVPLEAAARFVPLSYLTTSNHGAYSQPNGYGRCLLRLPERSLSARSMELFEPDGETLADRPFWGLRLVSLTLVLVALVLLVLAFVFRETSRSTSLLVPLFVALCCAAVLQIYYLVWERLCHRRDVTKRKHAEAQVVGHLAAAEAARAEAEALRKSTLALAENLSMDMVLDTLLQSLAEIVPYEAASVLLTEADSRLIVAREAPRSAKTKTVVVLEARDNPVLERVLRTLRSALVPDTAEEPDWKEPKPWARFRSWMLVPLVASEHVLGILAVGHRQARAFTQEHLRRTKSLAIGAAVAIQNARLYERAEFCSAALELRVKEIGEARN